MGDSPASKKARTTPEHPPEVRCIQCDVDLTFSSNERRDIRPGKPVWAPLCDLLRRCDLTPAECKMCRKCYDNVSQLHEGMKKFEQEMTKAKVRSLFPFLFFFFSPILSTHHWSSILVWLFPPPPSP